MKNLNVDYNVLQRRKPGTTAKDGANKETNFALHKRKLVNSKLDSISIIHHVKHLFSV